MPAPAVIPAPIAYVKFAAVKKLVVRVWGGLAWSAARRVLARSPRRFASCLCS